MTKKPTPQLVPLKDVHVIPGWNPRQTFDPIADAELEASVKQDGIVTPVLLRPHPTKQGFHLIAGERRYRASVKAGLTEIPAFIKVVDDQKARHLALIENLQRLNLSLLDESDALKLLAATHPLKELEAITRKGRKYVLESLALANLVPAIRDVVARGALPRNYAVKLGHVPTDKQATALDLCFAPLHDGDRYQLHNLQPIRQLSIWFDKNIRLNPKSPEAANLFPELATRIDESEMAKKIRIEQLSTLNKYTDRTEPRPLLAQNWKAVNPKKPCPHAKEGLIVVGEGRGDILLICRAKKDCRVHWPQSKPEPANVDRQRAEERRRQQAEDEQRLQEVWKSESRPSALKQIAQKAMRMPVNASLVQWCVQEITNREQEVAKLLGVPLTKVRKSHFAAAIVLAIALRHDWSFERLRPIAKRLRITLDPPRLKKVAA